MCVRIRGRFLEGSGEQDMATHKRRPQMAAVSASAIGYDAISGTGTVSAPVQNRPASQFCVGPACFELAVDHPN